MSYNKAYDMLDRALNDVRRAAEDHANAERGHTLDADALYQLTRMTEGVRDRVAAEPVLDGTSRMLPVQALVPGDQLIGPDGSATETVKAVTYHLYTVDILTDADTTANVERTELIEVTEAPGGIA